MNRPIPTRAPWDDRRVDEREIVNSTWASRPLHWRWHFGRYRPHRRWRPTSAGQPDRVSRRSGPSHYATVLLPFAAGYYLSWVYYTINASIADRLAREFALSPSELGGLTATYLLGMAIVQIPLGSLTDRQGPRWVQSVCCLIAALGALVFAVAGSLPTLLIGRFLLGVGTATSFTAIEKVCVLGDDLLRESLGDLDAFEPGWHGALAEVDPPEVELDLVDVLAIGTLPAGALDTDIEVRPLLAAGHEERLRDPALVRRASRSRLELRVVLG